MLEEKKLLYRGMWCDMDEVNHGMYQKIKRCIDFLISLIGFIILIPVFLILIICIKLDSRGSILFKQRRIGIHKKEFNILKFRTMRIDTPKDTPTHLLENPDMYITRVGKLLRKTSLDEFPQFLNVLNGDMSFVGPRPKVGQIDFGNLTEDKKKSYSIKPGVTGYAQAYYRNSISNEEKYHYDAYYSDHLSFWLDVKVVFMTFWSVIGRKNINTLQSKENSSCKKGS